MDLTIEVLDTVRTDDGKNRVYIKINNNQTTSVILTDTEIASPAAAKASITTQLKSKNHVGSVFTITI